jgi:hypothetical protein
MKRDTLMLFVFGDVFSTGFTLLFDSQISHFMLKMIGTAIAGIIGGLAAKATRDIYPILKKLLFDLKRKLFNKQKPS